MRPRKFSPAQIKEVFALKHEREELQRMLRGELSFKEIAKAAGIASTTCRNYLYDMSNPKNCEWKAKAQPLLEKRKTVKRRLDELSPRLIAKKFNVTDNYLYSVWRDYDEEGVA